LTFCYKDELIWIAFTKIVSPLETCNKEVGTALEYYQSGQIKINELGRYVARTGE